MVNRHDFKREVEQLADKIGVTITEIHMRKMSRKWASCSSRGRLTYDPAILRKPDEERYRMIIHELLHLRYPNHGKMFKTMLDIYVEKAVRGDLFN
ncbi:MAG: M48 family metallopeptidase [Candidatus Thermoplasmatota archaeon]|nr:M48 family metallopeptidase [Candidatus Thermoplasmatota archaeon]MDD5778194.1 M48 family metallopeptidase [Candidatus Thermoplasmatota archaeon]